MLSFDTDKEFKDNYKFLIGSILPRPIAWVSTCNQNGSFNLAPFSFFTAISAKPMIIGFCPLIRTATGDKKDTVKNIEREKEFVVNFVTQSNYEMVNGSSAELPYGESEFDLVKAHTIESEKIKAPRVKESPIHFECKLRDILSYGDEPGCGRLITGEVIRVHVDESLYQDGRIDTDTFSPIGRGAGNDWIRCVDRFQMDRLMQAQIQK